jgi:hypothetical protein
MPVGPHVEIARIQAAETARRARHRLRRGEDALGDDAVPPGLTRRQRERAARKAARVAAESAAARRWRVAACSEPE